MLILITAFTLATIVPLISLYLIYKLDLYRMGQFRVVLLCFAWGLISFGLAFAINRTSLRYNLVSYDFFLRFSAPFVEEILKALILLYLIRRPNFTYLVDGAIYAFAVGVGFAVIENYDYILAHQSAALGLAISRVLSTNLMHAAAASLVGISAGFARFQRKGFKLLPLIVGLLAAMAVHMGFNNLVTRISSGLLLLFAAGMGLGGAGVTALVIKRGLSEEKNWIEETLGDADRVTEHEAAVVHRLSDLKAVLEPIAERFGEEKTAQMEHFLVLQAQLGIKRKTLEKLNDERMAQAVKAQMDQIRAEMDTARKEVGAYAMLYLRNIFPPEASPVWGQIEAAIDTRVTNRPATGGMNLWQSLDERASKPNPASQEPSDD